jgi:site-specific DNA recombinase
MTYRTGVRAAIYARYSSALQSESSIDAQLASCRQFCVARGYTVAAEYIDRAESGSTTERTQFKRLMADVQAAAYNVVITHKLDRLSRSMTDVMLIMREFQGRAVTYASVTEQFDFTTPIGKIILAVLAGMAEWYLENLRTEINKGKHERAMNGRVNASILPFGYRRERIGEEHTTSGKVRVIYKIVIDEAEAPHVR